MQGAPEGGALTRPAPATPTAQPTHNQPPVPQTPQGEPPRFDFKRGIPTAITTASLGKLAADRMNEAEGLRVPQGLTEAQFEQLSARVRESAGHYGSDIRVHGSRAAGTARPDSDIDIAIRVSPERFDQIIRERFKTPNPGSDKEERMLHAQRTGKIQRGELGLSGLGRSLERELGHKVDISVIREGGTFDEGPWTSLK